jgi:hypothetical protein
MKKAAGIQRIKREAPPPKSVKLVTAS